MTAPFPIPDSWVWTTLGEIAEVVGGVTKDSKKQSDPNLPQVPYLRVANVQRGYLDLREITQIRVPEPTVSKLRLQIGDVLLNEGGDRDKLGRGWIWQGQIADCIHQNHVFRARLSGSLHPKLLAWYANEIARDWFSQNASQSVNLASISLSNVKRLPVPLPPAAEQSRMVNALEEHLSHLESAVHYAQSSLKRAKGLRARLIADCVDGADGTWGQYVLGQVARSVRNGMYVSRPGIDPDGVPILRIGSVRALQLDITDIRYSGKSVSEVEQGGYLLQPRDLLFTRYNGNPEYVGACAAVPDGLGPLTYPDKLIRVRVNEAIAHPEYLAIACSAEDARAAIRQSVKTTAGQVGISGRELKNIPIRLPSLGDQKRRMIEFGEYDESVRRLESALTIACQRASSLRMAVMREAFAGRLASHDLMDEDASILLKRIRKSRA